MFNLYPPLLGAGIRVRVSKDYRHVRSKLRLRWWNRNHLGSHFGGSIYTMTDPFYTVMLTQQLGRGYVVWLKEATIRFRKPGRGRIAAEFAIDPERVEGIRRSFDESGRQNVTLAVEVRDEGGDLVAEVEQILSIRRRDPAV